MSTPGHIHVLDGPTALAEEAARLVVTGAQSGQSFSVALSGGTTPHAMFGLLASQFASLDLSRVHIFWSDERCVPPDSPESNYGVARDLWLSRVEIPSENVHRMKGELEPVAAAVDYCKELSAFFGRAVPRFDLCFLGLGSDGHTASLFPGWPALAVTDAVCVANHVPLLAVSPWRLTLTYPVINASKTIAFLVEGSAKADIVQRVIEGPRDPRNLPAQGVEPADGELLWLLDRAAAAKLRM